MFSRFWLVPVHLRRPQASSRARHGQVTAEALRADSAISSGPAKSSSILWDLAKGCGGNMPSIRPAKTQICHNGVGIQKPETRQSQSWYGTQKAPGITDRLWKLARSCDPDSSWNILCSRILSWTHASYRVRSLRISLAVLRSIYIYIHIYIYTHTPTSASAG